MLRASGFDAKVVNSRVATTEKQLEPWTFPVMVVLSEDETSVTIILGLAKIKDATKELRADTLLKIMCASQKHAPKLLVYNADRLRTDWSFTLKNEHLSGTMLRRQVNRIAILARKTSNFRANPEQKPVASPTPSTASDPTPTQPAVTLTGQWSAAKSDKKAFAVDLKADETFNLVYLNNGQQTKSSGKFTATQESLILTANDGLKLTGKLVIGSEKEFRFELQNSAALIFKKAN